MGGVSVYVDRLSRELRRNGTSLRNIQLGRRSLPGRFLDLVRIVFDPRPTVIDLHAFDFSAMAAALLRPFRKVLTYMDHNTLIYGREITGLRARILKRFFERADEVAFVSSEGKLFYEQKGFTFRNAIIKNAFIVPPVEEGDRIASRYSQETRAFLKTRHPLLVANASQVVFKDGVDLYGLDLCVDLVLGLRAEFPNIGLLFALADPNSHKEYLATLKQRISEGGAESNFHFLTGHQELWPVFRDASLMIRPTTGDGFAVSVAEALSLGCPVIASDAVGRPAEVTLFRNRNLEDLDRKARTVLAQGRPGQ